MNIVWMLSVRADFIANFLGALRPHVTAVASLGQSKRIFCHPISDDPATSERTIRPIFRVSKKRK
jgi:hypothetical protein